MSTIFETKHFIVEAPELPHVDRNDGGHIKIEPKIPVNDRTQFTSVQAKELVMLTMVVGEAMKTVLNAHGVDVERINYQENGNWRPVMHEHLYGRAKSAKVQMYGEALRFPKRETGFYDACKPLTEGDVLGIRIEIERLLKTDKYKQF